MKPVQIPIMRLKPEAVFEVPGVPDWLAVDARVGVEQAERQHYRDRSGDQQGVRYHCRRQAAVFRPRVRIRRDLGAELR